MLRSRMGVLSALLTVAILASCTATQVDIAGGPNAPDFLFGLWHGFIAPIAFLVSVFNENVRVYAFPNTGIGYDFGFMLGISGFSGGVFGGSRRAKNRS